VCAFAAMSYMEVQRYGDSRIVGIVAIIVIVFVVLVRMKSVPLGVVGIKRRRVVVGSLWARWKLIGPGRNFVFPFFEVEHTIGGELVTLASRSDKSYATTREVVRQLGAFRVRMVATVSYSIPNADAYMSRLFSKAMTPAMCAASIVEKRMETLTLASKIAPTSVETTVRRQLCSAPSDSDSSVPIRVEVVALPVLEICVDATQEGIRAFSVIRADASAGLAH